MRLSKLSSILVGLAGIAPRSPAAQTTAATPLDVRIYWPPASFLASDSLFAAYELHVTNVSRRTLTLTGLDVSQDSAGRKPVQVLRGPALTAAMSPVGARDSGQSVLVLRSGQQAVVFVWLWISQESDSVVAMYQRFFLFRPDSLNSAPDTVGPVRAPIQMGQQVTIDAPLDGGPWLARNGPSNISDHRRTLLSIAGVSLIAQRFATDWIKLGPDNRVWKGDSTVNRNWYGYGAPVRAVASGVVVAVHEGVPENIPLSAERAVPITLETVAGNYVIEKIGPDRYALYAHLQPGSVRVHVNERVTARETLGLLGNSGNSGAPHLHFHLMTASASPLGGEGIPFGFRDFVSDGTIGSVDDLFGAKAWQPRSRIKKRRELPTENMVVEFP